MNTKITIDTTLERDIDLLIIEEFISDKAFADMILSPFEIGESYTIEQDIHSKTDVDLSVKIAATEHLEI